MNAMWLAIVPSAMACVTHHHVTAGPTTSLVNGTRGAEVTGEVTGSSGGLMTIAGATVLQLLADLDRFRSVQEPNCPTILTRRFRSACGG